MSKSIGILYHPTNNYPVPIYDGFSWPNLFFGVFWYMYKGVYVWAIISFIAAMFTFGFSQLIFPFFANRHHTESLYKKGYLKTPRNSG